MSEIVLKSLGFVAVIVVTCLMKRAGIFRKEDGRMLSDLMLKVTMPCALLSAGQNLKLSAELPLTLALAVGFNLILAFGGVLLAKKYGHKMQGVFAINCSGFNVGSFTLPFVQYFFPASVLGYVCMFDMGNCIMNLAVNNTIGAAVAASETRPSAKDTAKRLLTMPPFIVYIIVIVLAVLGLSLPSGILTVVSIAGNANAFVAMAMIGILLEIELPKKEIHLLLRLLAGRYGLVLAMGLFVWFCLPLIPSAKKVLILCIAAPITSTGPVFTSSMVGESDIPAAANSISIILSLTAMTILTVLFA